MDKGKMDIYRIRLINERDRMRRIIEDITNANAGLSQRESTDELSMIDNHPGDVATEMHDKERDFALIRNERHLLEEVELALRKIESGSYGSCESCGKTIEYERLDFLPSAVTCVECEKKKRDYRTFKYDRPVEEERMAAFGKYFMDSPKDQKEEVAFNAEDTWQEVEMVNEYPGHRRVYDNAYHDAGLYGEDDQDDDDYGYVEKIEQISNQYYKDQLP